MIKKLTEELKNDVGIADMEIAIQKFENWVWDIAKRMDDSRLSVPLKKQVSVMKGLLRSLELSVLEYESK